MPSQRPQTRPTLVHAFRSRDLQGSVYCGEALTYLGLLPRDSADILFLDPPFNLGKRYGPRPPRLDRHPDPDYSAWLSDLLRQAVRVLAPGGSLYLYHLPRWAMRFGMLLDDLGLNFQHWVAVSMKNGFARGRRLYPAHYALLMFSKSGPRIFRRPRLPAPRCRNCNALVKDYGGYRAIIEEKGINLSDIWEDLSPVRHRALKHRAANELPPRLLQRVIEISGEQGALYVDPFGGSGTGVLEAVKAGMRFSCCEIIEDNAKVISRRLLVWRRAARALERS